MNSKQKNSSESIVLLPTYQPTYITEYNNTTTSKLSICCYWTLVLGIGGTIIGATAWSLIHYYS